MQKQYSNSGIIITPVVPTLNEVQSLLVECGKKLGFEYKPSIKNKNTELNEILKIKEKLKNN